MIQTSCIKQYIKLHYSQFTHVIYYQYNSQINLPQRLPMTKRSATYDIDPNTFEEKQRDNEGGNPIDPQGSHMKNRKIYKITKKEPFAQTQSTSRPSLRIVGLEDQLPAEGRGEEKQPAKPESSLFSSNLNAYSQGAGLFANLFSTNFNKQIALTNTTDQKKPDSLNTVKSQELTPKPSSLFTFTQNNQNSIFNNSSLNAPLSNKSIFSGGIPTQAFGTNLFSFTTKPVDGQSLFQKNQNKREDQGEGENQGDSAELQLKQNMQVDPTKSSVKFDYGQQCQVIKAVKLAKFKKDKGELLDSPLTAALLFDRGTKSHYLVVYLTATHKAIFSGLVLKEKSQVRQIGSKEDNVQILVFGVEKNQKKLERHVLKMQIAKDKDEDCRQFLEAVKQVVQPKKDASKDE